MQRIWYGVIMVSVLMPILYFIGFAMNDLLKDIRKKKDDQKRRHKDKHRERKKRGRSKAGKGTSHLRAVK